ncbi:MAG: hypothetical protein J6P98_06105 [Clostridia bacterium]|nr:hypothetical protein [Clostridia bacterium]
MEEERCTLFSFLTGGGFAAALHFLCAVSGWCALVFPLLPALLFLIERNGKARSACIHTGIISLVTAALCFIPVVLWLIIRAASHASGAFYVICTVLFVAVIAIIWFALLVTEVACAVRSLKGEPVEVPFITSWVARLEDKMQ